MTVSAGFVPNDFYWKWLEGKKGSSESKKIRKVFESKGILPGDPDDISPETLEKRLLIYRERIIGRH